MCLCPTNGLRKTRPCTTYAGRSRRLQAARELARKFEFQLAHHVTYASLHVPTQLWRLGIPVVFGPVGGGQTAPGSMLSYFGAEKVKEQLRSSITKALRFSPFHRQWLRRMRFIFAANRDTLNIAQTLGCKNASLMCDTAMRTEYFAERSRNFENAKRASKASLGRTNDYSKSASVGARCSERSAPGCDVDDCGRWNGSPNGPADDSRTQSSAQSILERQSHDPVGATKGLCRA